MIGAGFEGMLAEMVGLFVGPICTLMVPTRTIQLPGRILVGVALTPLMFGLACCWLAVFWG
jgi:hypothetical protein